MALPKKMCFLVLDTQHVQENMFILALTHTLDVLYASEKQQVLDNVSIKWLMDLEELLRSIVPRRSLVLVPSSSFLLLSKCAKAACPTRNIGTILWYFAGFKLAVFEVLCHHFCSPHCLGLHFLQTVHSHAGHASPDSNESLRMCTY